MGDPDPGLAAALGRILSGVSVLTGRGTQATGMLTSWVQQCAFEPPSVSVAVKQGRLHECLAARHPFRAQYPWRQPKPGAHFGRGLLSMSLL